MLWDWINQVFMHRNTQQRWRAHMWTHAEMLLMLITSVLCCVYVIGTGIVLWFFFLLRRTTGISVSTPSTPSSNTHICCLFFCFVLNKLRMHGSRLLHIFQYVCGSKGQPKSGQPTGNVEHDWTWRRWPGWKCSYAWGASSSPVWTCGCEWINVVFWNTFCAK